MPDAQTIFEFRLACHKQGCPVCTLVQRSGARYIEGVLNESLLDPGVHLKLAKSQGFCYEHTWQSIDMKLSDALGQAILYQDLIKGILLKIQENERTTGDQLAQLLDPVATCPVCLLEKATLDRVVDALAIALRDQDFVGEFKQSAGLCLPHLQKVLPKLDGKRLSIILSHQQTCLETLNGELGEFIRKSDYRFRDEIIGREGDSYKRAADIMVGKHRPIERKDLG